MLSKILAKASASRRSIRSIDKMTGSDLLQIKKPLKKGLSSGALKKQSVIRQAYADESAFKGYKAARDKTGYGNVFKESLADRSEMNKYLYKKTPKTQMALSAAKYGTVFGAGGYFLNREDENEE